jgi:hypothetical protein
MEDEIKRMRHNLEVRKMKQEKSKGYSDRADWNNCVGEGSSTVSEVL